MVPQTLTAPPARPAPDQVAVLIDGRVAMHWDRTRELTPEQRRGIAELDRELRAGFEVNGVRYARPELLPRAQFAASVIPQALREGRSPAAQLALAFVCTRLPDLRQIQYRHRSDGRYDIAFITDRDYDPGERPVRMRRPRP